MAGWITHLRIAAGLADLIGRNNLDLVNFYVGSIAPDGGVPTDAPDVYLPPKSVTHLGVRGKRDYAGFEARYLKNTDDIPAFSFYLGYYCHVMTDEQWGTYIYFPELEAYLDSFPDRLGFNRAMKDNWEALDMNFVKSFPDWEPYRLLADLNKFENKYLEAFPGDAFDKLLSRFREFYAGASESDDHEYKYLTVEYHDSFIKNCTDFIYNEFICKKFSDKLYKAEKMC